MNFGRNYYMGAGITSDVINLSQIDLTPWPAEAFNPIRISYQGTTNPLENDRVVETSFNNLSESLNGNFYYAVEGNFVFELEGTVSFEDGVYTATYTKTLVASESSVKSITSVFGDAVQYYYWWPEAVAVEDIAGKALSELITDGIWIGLDAVGSRVTGTSADESYALGGGNDWVDARGGDDLIFGGDDQDRLTGGAGADWIFGEFGRDRLTGGAGADRFTFQIDTDSAKRRTADVITDFKHGKDKVDLEPIDARRGEGNQAFKFLGEEDFSGKRGQLIVEHDGHGKHALTHVYADTNGDRKADFVVILDGDIHLAASDFFL